VQSWCGANSLALCNNIGIRCLNELSAILWRQRFLAGKCLLTHVCGGSSLWSWCRFGLFLVPFVVLFTCHFKKIQIYIVQLNFKSKNAYLYSRNSSYTSSHSDNFTSVLNSDVLKRNVSMHNENNCEKQMDP